MKERNKNTDMKQKTLTTAEIGRNWLLVNRRRWLKITTVLFVATLDGHGSSPAFVLLGSEKARFPGSHIK
jgi:hypothetical protein